MNPIQLFDPVSCTFTYIVIDPVSRHAVIIDPVDEQLERDLGVLLTHQLSLDWIIETHAHADHITSARRLTEHTGAKTATPLLCNVASATQQLNDSDVLTFGTESLTALSTPGHTAGSMSFVWRNTVFTGDSLLIEGCGRTDFQSGSAAVLYDSITTKLFTLPNDTIVYPGHDYQGRTQSTIGREKQFNPRLANKTQAQFIELMAQLNLPQPKRIHEAVPANLHLGLRQDSSDEVQENDISPQAAYDLWRENKVVLVDVRTDAEREWVGFIPKAIHIPWKQWPDMQLNPQFDEQLKAAIDPSQQIVFFCRSGVRAASSVLRATELGYTAFNMLGGFEGELNANAQRKHTNGWCANALPWRQS